MEPSLRTRLAQWQVEISIEALEVIYLPGLTGAVTSVLVPPVVGKIGQAAGDGIVAQFEGIVGNE